MSLAARQLQPNAVCVDRQVPTIAQEIGSPHERAKARQRSLTPLHP